MTTITTSFTQCVAITASEQLTNRTLLEYDDLGPTYLWTNAAGTGNITITLLQGAPYITAIFKNLTPIIAAVNYANLSTTLLLPQQPPGITVTASKFKLQLYSAVLTSPPQPPRASNITSQPAGASIQEQSFQPPQPPSPPQQQTVQQREVQRSYTTWLLYSSKPIAMQYGEQPLAHRPLKRGKRDCCPDRREPLHGNHQAGYDGGQCQQHHGCRCQQ